MAYTGINKSLDHFNTVLYTGNGSTQSITGVGFQPDFLWIKERGDGSSHALQDAVRGNTKKIMSNDTSVESTESAYVTSFDSDGFSIGTNNGINQSGITTVAWNWKANGAGSSNTDGSITSTVSANTTAGFSIVKWTGNSSAGATVGHGLGSTPKVVMIKRLDGSAQSWICKFPSSTDGYLELNTTSAVSSSSGWLPVSNSLITFANSWTAYNNSGDNYIAYCFAEKTGYSKFGSYVGNNNANGNFVYLGFRPEWILFKRVSDTENWSLYDSKRNGYNVISLGLRPNISLAESAYGGDAIDFVSNGFKIRNSGTNINNGTYVYMAFGQTMVGTNSVPCTAR